MGLEAGNVSVWEWYLIESLSFRMGSMHLLRGNPAGNPFTRELQCLHHRVLGNRFSVRVDVRLILRALTVVN